MIEEYKFQGKKVCLSTVAFASAIFLSACGGGADSAVAPETAKAPPSVQDTSGSDTSGSSSGGSKLPPPQVISPVVIPAPVDVEASNDAAEAERLEKERLEKERLEKERLERERLEKERLERERLERERLERERLERERLERERLERERLEREQAEKENAKEDSKEESKEEPEDEPISPTAIVSSEPRFNALYKRTPDPTNCYPGVMSDEAKRLVVAEVNQVRALHGLNPVVYDDDPKHNKQVMEAALMMSVNGGLEHYPPKDWKCYTQDGYDGASTSNLGLHWRLVGVQSSIHAWIIDERHTAGHRLWILNPFLKKFAYASIALPQVHGKNWWQSGVMKVIYTDRDSNTNGATKNDYVAYPVNDYPSKFWFNNKAMLSLSVVSNNDSEGANNGGKNFTNAIIKVTKRDDGQELAISDKGSEKNHVWFKAAGVVHNVIYDVSISSVTVDNQTRDYKYWFRIVD